MHPCSYNSFETDAPRTGLLLDVFGIRLLTDGDNDHTKMFFGPLYSSINDILSQFYNDVHS